VSDTVLVLHDGRRFSLTGHQRRAVLQALFSESSKGEKKSRRRPKRKSNHNEDSKSEAEDEEDDYGDVSDPLPFDSVVIQGASTVLTDLESDAGGDCHSNSIWPSVSCSRSNSSNADPEDEQVEEAEEVVPESPLTLSSPCAEDESLPAAKTRHENCTENKNKTAGFEPSSLPDLATSARTLKSHNTPAA